MVPDASTGIAYCGHRCSTTGAFDEIPADARKPASTREKWPRHPDFAGGATCINPALPLDDTMDLLTPREQ